MFSLRKKLFSFFNSLVLCSLLLYSCTAIDLYEKVVPIPKHQWHNNYKSEFTFNITDTASAYQLFFIIRHNNKYAYNNIWLNLHLKAPGDTVKQIRLDLPLANKEGWLGSGMDDIFEHRIAFSLDPEKFSFNRSGNYTFAFEQIMRDDPLAEVMNVGLRIEKKVQ